MLLKLRFSPKASLKTEILSWSIMRSSKLLIILRQCSKGHKLAIWNKAPWGKEMAYSVVQSYGLPFKNPLTSFLVIIFSLVGVVLIIHVCKPFHHITASQRSGGWKARLEIILSKPPAQSQGQLGEVAQGHVQVGFVLSPKTKRFHNLSGQHVLGFDHPHSYK